MLASLGVGLTLSSYEAVGMNRKPTGEIITMEKVDPRTPKTRRHGVAGINGEINAARASISSSSESLAGLSDVEFSFDEENDEDGSTHGHTPPPMDVSLSPGPGAVEYTAETGAGAGVSLINEDSSPEKETSPATSSRTLIQLRILRTAKAKRTLGFDTLETAGKASGTVIASKATTKYGVGKK